MTISGHNIFGTVSSSAPAPEIPYTTDATTAAGKLVDKIKNIADNAILKVASTTDWLSYAAEAGQNGGSESFVRNEWKPPAKLTSSNILTGWTAPAMPSLPAFPTLPADLKIDMATFKTNVAQLVNDLQNSWMAKFLPATTDTSRYDSLFKDILNGTDDATTSAKLESIETALRTAIDTTFASLSSDLTSQITTLRTNLATRRSGIQPLVDGAIATAKDETASIAWANARDRVAREGARQEAEVISDWAGRGFALPSGVLAAQQAMARQATYDAATKAAAEEALRAQEMNIDLAKTAIDAWLKTAQVELQADLESFRAPLESNMRYATMKLEADRAHAKQAFDHLGLRLDFSKFAGEFALKYRTAAIDGMNGLINAYANLARNEMEYMARIADAQRASLAALIEYYRASIAQAELGFRAALANNENDIKWANIAAGFIGTAVGHHVAAAQTTGQIYAQVAGQALSGLNAVTSVAASSS